MSDSRLKDKQWRIDNLYVIRDKEQRLVRFKRNKAQVHYNANKWSRNIILKSRQLGFTTDEAIDCLDDALFTRNMEALLIAHNLDAGRKIFDNKIELAWKNLHPDLKKFWKVSEDTSQTLKFDFGDNSFSSLAVDTSGRSGTYNRVHITEFAEIAKKYPQKAREIIEGTIPAVPTKGRVDIESTSQGASGDFYEMFMMAYERGEPTLPEEYKAHFYNWQWDEEIETMPPIPVSQMPKEFADYQKLHKLTDKEITYYFRKWKSLKEDWNALRREYPTTPEEAFEAIVEGAYYGVEIGIAERAGRFTAVSHDPALLVHTVWDLGVGENLAIGFYQRDTAANRLQKIDYWKGQGSDGMPEAIAAVRAKPYIYGKHFAPHDIRATDVSTGKTRMETAEKLGIKFDIVPDMNVEDGINAAKLVLARLWVDKENCKDWILAMKNYVRKWDDKRGMYLNEPYHNWASHGADEWRYAALCEDKMINEVEQTKQELYFPKQIEDELGKPWRP